MITWLPSRLNRRAAINAAATPVMAFAPAPIPAAAPFPVSAVAGAPAAAQPVRDPSQLGQVPQREKEFLPVFLINGFLIDLPVPIMIVLIVGSLFYTGLLTVRSRRNSRTWEPHAWDTFTGVPLTVIFLMPCLNKETVIARSLERLRYRMSFRGLMEGGVK